MKNIKIKINTENAAFDNGNRAIEISRILREIAEKIETGAIGDFTIKDINGNTVGMLKMIDMKNTEELITQLKESRDDNEDFHIIYDAIVNIIANHYEPKLMRKINRIKGKIELWYS